jgi:hypothetical protein
MENDWKNTEKKRKQQTGCIHRHKQKLQWIREPAFHEKRGDQLSDATPTKSEQEVGTRNNNKKENRHKHDEVQKDKTEEKVHNNKEWFPISQHWILSRKKVSEDIYDGKADGSKWDTDT